MKRTNTFCLVFGSLFLVLTAIAPLQATGWGTADTRLLLIIHPDMAYFDYTNGRFFRPQVAKQSPAEVRQAMQKAREQAEPLLSKHQEHQHALQEARSEILMNKERLRLRLLNPQHPTLETAKNRLKTAKKNVVKVKSMKDIPNIHHPPEEMQVPESHQDRNKLVDELEERAQTEVASINARLIAIDKQITAVQEAMYSPVYLTTPETTEKLAAINKEIGELITQTAGEQKLDLIIDASYAQRSIKRAAETTILPTQPDIPDLLSSALFHEFANFALLKEPPPRDDGSPVPPQHGTGAMYTNKIQLFKKYLENRHYLPPTVANFAGGSLFLTGANDVTPRVAEKLLTRYNIPATYKDGLLEVIKEFVNTEKDAAVPEDLIRIPK
jgi:hypothetical protein